MFIDKTHIYVKAGRGGNGCDSFYKPRGSRHKYPNGGAGGKGGDIYLICDDSLATLLDFHYKKDFRAGPGKHGSSNNKKGKDGKDLFIKVPLGTIVKNASSHKIIKDFCCITDKVLVAKGGRGGKGNTSRRIAELGKEGQQLELELELKLIADVGLVGLPNVGKSTFLKFLTNAKTKIAGYPFTTKTPVLGTVKIADFDFVIADIPGLIEGAHRGRGLGHEFLRHIERTKVLVLMVDVSKARVCSPVESYAQLIKELKLYNKNLIDKPRIIALNKVDQIDEKFNISEFSKFVKEKSIFSISSVTGKGIKELVTQIKNLLENGTDKGKKAGYR